MYRSWNRFFWNRLKFWCGICFIPKVWCYLVGTLHVSLTTVQNHNHNHNNNHSEQRKQIIGILWWLVWDSLGSCWAGERGGPSAAVQRLLWAGDQWSLARVPGQSWPQLPQLLQPHLVPTNKRLCQIWDKFDSLLISCTPLLVFVGQGEGVAQKPGPCSCSLSGWVTITSNAAYLPPAHLGMNISAGLRLARPSVRGARPSEAAESWIASLRSLCGQQVFLKYSVTCFQKSEVPPLVILFFLKRLSGPSEIYICSSYEINFHKKTGCSDEISFNVFARVGKVWWETSVLKCFRAKMFKCKIL